MNKNLQPDQYLETALHAISTDQSASALDSIPVPVYRTDAQGAVTYWNRACVEFAGREPQLGQDKWCVTWRIYTTTGDYLPHNQCPMADAIRQKRPIRGAVAIAMRPDGSRRAFRPYPTPLFDADGKLAGAVNMLIDVTEEQSAALVEQADRCRRLAEATYDRETSSTLCAMAEGYARTARDLSSPVEAEAEPESAAMAR
jgi:PAS domain S-box-containing protein